MGKINLHKLLAVAIVFFSLVIVTQANTLTKADIYKLRSTAQVHLADPVIDTPFDWPICNGIQRTGVINASSNTLGLFGSGYLQRYNDSPIALVSFESPPDSKHEYLFAAAIWVGGIVGNDTLVSIGHDGWSGGRDFSPNYGLGKPGMTKIEGYSDFSMRAAFTDTAQLTYPVHSHNSLGVRIANRSHVWRSDPYNNSIVYDMVITNISDQLIESGFLAIKADADVISIAAQGDYTDDIAGSIAEAGIGYVIDDDGDPNGSVYDDASLPKALAMKFLGASFVPTTTNFTWHINSSDPAYDFSPRQRADLTEYCYGDIGFPKCYSDMYHVMSYPEWDYDMVRTAEIDSLDPIWRYPQVRPVADDISEGEDVVIIMSIGPFDLLPDSSVRIQYTMFTADDIHTDPTNYADHLIQNYDPDSYLTNLNLEQLIPNAEAAEEKAATLFDPLLPPVGLTLIKQTDNTATIEWDPWVLNNIEGYDLFLTPIDPDQLPHQGIIPDWYRPSEPLFYGSLEVANGVTLAIADSTLPYLLQIRHRTAAGVGQFSLPLIIKPFYRPKAPELSVKHLFTNDSGSVRFEWNTADELIGHFNIYRIPSDSILGRPFEPFYSFNREAVSLGPVDSSLVDNYWQFYFAMNASQTIAGNLRSAELEISDGDIILISAVDQNGFESALTSSVLSHLIPPREADVLYIITDAPNGHTREAPVTTRIDSVLSGIGLAYEILVIEKGGLSIPFPNDLPASMVLGYKWVLVDDGPNRFMNYDWYRSLALFIQSGGHLACFSFNALNPLGEESYWRAGNLPAEMGYELGDYFDIDSAFYADIYLNINSVQIPDTVCGFQSALSVDNSLPSVSYDTSIDPAGLYDLFWPEGSPAGVTVYDPGERAKITHLFQSKYPDQSLMQNLPVGIKTTTINGYGEHVTFAFGFHLHQMKKSEARDFVVALTNHQSCCGRYTSGRTGNVNSDSDGLRNMADIVRLIDRIYLSKKHLYCEANGNVDGDPLDKLNISDITSLIDHIFLSKVETTMCQ